MAEPGQVIGGKYKLIRVVGDGGMGTVYEAEHMLLGTRVAVKILHPEMVRRAGLIDRFLQEARVSARIQNPHVVRVTDVDRSPDGVAFLVMDLLQGEPLSKKIERERTLSVPVACEFTLQILDALESAHAIGVVHRDLKPENVFITDLNGAPLLKLIDFGIAKLKHTDDQAKNLTSFGTLMGTAEYMAPEQAFSADQVDARADIYAVGVMLFEMLAGSRPVSGDNGRVVAVKVERGEVTPLVRVAPHVPPELAGLVHRAMAFRAELRFESAMAMRQALQSILSAHGGARLSAPQQKSATVMGAPAAAALTPLAPEVRGGTSMQPGPPQFTGGPLIAPASSAAGVESSVRGSADTREASPGAKRPRRSRPVWPFVLAIALLAAGGAAAYQWYLVDGTNSPEPAPSVAPVPVPSSAPPALVVVPSVPPTPTTVAPLTPGAPTVVTPSRPSTPPNPTTPADPTVAPPPIQFPPLPTQLPFPLPTVSPSGYVIPPWPSALPGFPGFPPPPAASVAP